MFCPVPVVCGLGRPLTLLGGGRSSRLTGRRSGGIIGDYRYKDWNIFNFLFVKLFLFCFAQSTQTIGSAVCFFML